MPATVWSAVRQRQPTGKRVSQRPAKPVKLVFLGVYRNVTRGMSLCQFCGDHLKDRWFSVYYFNNFYLTFFDEPFLFNSL